MITETLIGLEALPLHRLDSDTFLLKKAFDITYNTGLFRLFEYEPMLQDALKFELFSTLPGRSGSLAFLGVQILAANRIMAGNGFAKTDEYVNKKCGIAINHLRAPVTVVEAHKSGPNFALNGRLTWASGYGIFDHLVIGFHHEGREMEAVVPFDSQSGMLIGDAPETFVGNAMNTVNIELKDYIVPAEHIISSHPIGSYTRAKSLSKTVHYALYGIGLGALEAIDDAEVKNRAAAELEAIKDAFVASRDGAEMDRLRIELFELLQCTITTGMILVGGKSILASQSLQRYYRELIMFNSNGLNNTIKGLFKDSYLGR